MKDYRIMLCDNYNSVYLNYDINGAYIGEFIDFESKEKVISIIYMRDLYKNARKHCAVFNYSKGIDIFVSPLFLEQYKDKEDLFIALMYHELGHYINGDLNEENLKNLDKRNNFMYTGIVDSMEVKADAFAVSYVGKSLMISALNNLIKERRKRNDEIASLAIKEVEERIKLINRY